MVVVWPSVVVLTAGVERRVARSVAVSVAVVSETVMRITPSNLNYL